MSSLRMEATFAGLAVAALALLFISLPASDLLQVLVRFSGLFVAIRLGLLVVFVAAKAVPWSRVANALSLVAFVVTCFTLFVWRPSILPAVSFLKTHGDAEGVAASLLKSAFVEARPMFLMALAMVAGGLLLSASALLPAALALAVQAARRVTQKKPKTD